MTDDKQTTPWTSDEIEAATAFMEELNQHSVTVTILTSDIVLHCIRAALEALDLKRSIML